MRPRSPLRQSGTHPIGNLTGAWDAPEQRTVSRGRDYPRIPELNRAVPIVGALPLRTLGPVLLQVGTSFVVPTDGQVYDPTDGAVTVPIEVPEFA